MRVLGFSKKWDKLTHETFTTFRVPRKDKDWQVDEQVQIVYHPRSPKRRVLGIALIVSKQPLTMGSITNQEALEDGFPCGFGQMWAYMEKAHPGLVLATPINKLIIEWKKKL